jgi:hypothetical protein
MKRIAAAILALLALLALCTSSSQAGCAVRARAVVREVVVAQVVTNFATVLTTPVFQAGYGYGSAHYAEATPARSSDALLVALIDAKFQLLESRLLQAMGGNAPLVAPQVKTSFLIDQNRCGKCHTGPGAKGDLDLSKGLAFLSADQLIALTVRSEDPDDPKAMPPKTSGIKPLSDDEYRDLRKGVIAQLKLAKK